LAEKWFDGFRKGEVRKGVVPKISSKIASFCENLHNYDVILSVITEVLIEGVVIPKFARDPSLVFCSHVKVFYPPIETPYFECDCKRYLECLHPCLCVSLVILKASQNPGVVGRWSVFDLCWFNKCWYSSVWVEQYSVGNCLLFWNQESHDGDDLRPWPKPPALSGRKKKDTKRGNKGTRKCAGCGKVGHNVRRCNIVDLDKL